MKNSTAKQFCKCKSEFQDTQYGKGIRICNPTTRGTLDTRVVRCTVCNSEHSIKK